ncbi:MAG: T9SS type A sorting domain-containing protein [Bacteroidia bacterium]|jgi:hypothetical protein|nr:T9SS type A sorting domain-containing protein [Bacteroidia bacterium]
MKKLFTLLLLAFAAIGFAQTDIALESIDKPDYIKDGTDGTTSFELQFTMKNNGAALAATDTIVYSWGILNGDRTAVVVNATPRLFIIGNSVPTGGSFQSPVFNVGVNGTVGTSAPINLAVLTYVFNRGTNPVDADSTDNLITSPYIWEKQYGASVADLTYNENIAAYPNPANDVLNVNLLFATSKDVQVELFDLSGKIATTQENTTAVSPTYHKLDVSGLEKGIYILKVTNGDTVSTRKVTITH